MSILFAILKILGILLLVILVLVVLFLFHPVFYQVKGRIEDEISIRGHFWWLFQILRFEFSVENAEVKLRFRIFGFARTIGTKETEEEEISGDETDSFLSKQQVPETTGEDRQTEDREPEAAAESELTKRKKSFQKHKKPETDKKQKRKDTFESLKRECQDEKNRMAAAHMWQEVIYILSHLKPKYIQTEISFSTGDPAATGQVTGALSLLPVLYRYDAHIYPDFTSDEFYIRGNFSLKGHMSLYHAVICLIRIIRDKNIRRLIRRIRKQEVTHGRQQQF